MTGPKVSMVIPCYNKKDYISDMFESVIAQDYDNIELILTDDGSTDGTSEIIKNFVPKFLERGFDVVLIKQRNQGVSAAVKHGLMRMTGEFVCMPDCDDILMPDYVSYMAGYLISHPECETVRTVADKHCFSNAILSCDYLTSVLLGRSSISVCVMMIRVTLIEKLKLVDNIDTKCHYTQEPDISVPIGFFANNFTYINKLLYIYRPTQGMNLRSKEDEVYAKNDLEARHSEILSVISEYTIPDKYKTYAEILYNRLSYSRKLITKDEYNKNLLLIAKKLGVIIDKRSKNIYHDLTNAILGIMQTVKKDYLNNTTGKLIFYGVFGKIYEEYSYLLEDAGMKPDILYDKKQGEPLVTKPGDIIIVFPASHEIYDEVIKLHLEAKIVRFTDVFEYSLKSENKD